MKNICTFFIDNSGFPNSRSAAQSQRDRVSLAVQINLKNHSFLNFFYCNQHTFSEKMPYFHVLYVDQQNVKGRNLY